MKTITATVVGYTKGPCGPVQHTIGRRTFTTERALREAVRNADSVLSRTGAGHICLDQDSGLAFQVSGYSWNRGAYCDLISREELAPFLG